MNQKLEVPVLSEFPNQNVPILVFHAGSEIENLKRVKEAVKSCSLCPLERFEVKVKENQADTDIHEFDKKLRKYISVLLSTPGPKKIDYKVIAALKKKYLSSAKTLEKTFNELETEFINELRMLHDIS
eukprot:snap_masked-scaffold_3-processed-gene-16.53-mRNA-1 protein AED:1.00 eAED:1.00 QI:0/-1/0/0/-1/1/1/0/127